MFGAGDGEGDGGVYRLGAGPVESPTAPGLPPIMVMVGTSASAPPGHTTRTQRPRLNAARKVERDRAIVIDRNKGFSWPVIAGRYSISERQCRTVYGEWRDTEKESRLSGDPLEWLVETLTRYDSIISSLALIADEAANEAARVGALRSQMVAMGQQAALMVASGLLPSNLRTARDYETLVAVIDGMVAVVERHDLDTPVLDDLLRVVEHGRADAASPGMITATT